MFVLFGKCLGTQSKWDRDHEYSMQGKPNSREMLRKLIKYVNILTIDKYIFILIKSNQLYIFTQQRLGTIYS